MTAHMHRSNATAPSLKGTMSRFAILAIVGVTLAGCRSHLDPTTSVKGWLVTDPAERHPIMLSKQPSTMALNVRRGSYGLTAHQRGEVAHFFERYRSEAANNGKLVIDAPSGGANEVAVQHVIGELRHIAADMGFDQTSVGVNVIRADHNSAPPVRLAYLRYVAEGPECGTWPENLAVTSANLNYADFGCSNQKNFAAMVANPADLDGPRTMTPRSSTRRDAVWDKFKKGESTVTKKDESERVKVESE